MIILIILLSILLSFLSTYLLKMYKIKKQLTKIEELIAEVGGNTLSTCLCHKVQLYKDENGELLFYYLLVKKKGFQGEFDVVVEKENLDKFKVKNLMGRTIVLDGEEAIDLL